MTGKLLEDYKNGKNPVSTIQEHIECWKHMAVGGVQEKSALAQYLGLTTEELDSYNKKDINLNSVVREKVLTLSEKILCSAIWYKDIELKLVIEHNVLPKNCDKGVVFCGFRHCHCMYTMCSVTGKRSITSDVGEYVQGFLTNTNRFVDRKEGAKIHCNNGGKLGFSTNELYSEDLY